ncbi:MAG TPA: hypothetical protein VGQ46_10085 [Thermoanaerobaculia bacterium]|jgi:hypothetical protein|nr:hypothetical protein [Thermoanaerobaculia bacterium]
MYSKNLVIAIATLLLLASCSSTVPWANEPIGEEVNLSFVVRNNLLFLPSATIDGRPGRFLFGAAGARTALDQRFAAALPRSPRSGEHVLQLNEKESLRFTPVEMDLHKVADGIIGADVWGSRAVSIDYTSGLLTYQKEGIHPELMTLYRFTAEPRVNVLVDGKTISAIVDTASPDTLTLPRGTAAAGRTRAHIQLAGADLGLLDVKLADVADARAGNRILSKFLVSIDYGKREVGLWRDPRRP